MHAEIRYSGTKKEAGPHGPANPLPVVNGDFPGTMAIPLRPIPCTIDGDVRAIDITYRLG